MPAEGAPPDEQPNWQHYRGARAGEQVMVRNQPCERVFVLCNGWAFRFFQLSKDQPAAAINLLDTLRPKRSEDWLLYARALDRLAELPQTDLVQRDDLTRRAGELRVAHRFSLDTDFSE